MKLRNKKTGKILKDVKYIDTSLTTVEIHYLDNGILRMETEKDYHSFLKNWEDYEPKEPLIKDENVRRVVKAWADFNRAYPIYRENNYTLSYNHVLRIEFKDRVFENLDGRPYTITELCGEEE